MIGKLDRYVFKAVLGAWGAALLFLILLRVLFDVLLELGDYLEGAQKNSIGGLEFASLLVRYYVVEIPFVFVTVGPFVTVIAGMFAMSRLMGANEVAPMMFTGRSLVRVLRPVLLVAVASAACMAACWEFVLPRVTELHDQLHGELTAKRPTIENIVIRLRDNGSRTLICDEYDHHLREMQGVWFVDVGSGGPDTIVVRAVAAEWNPDAGGWNLTGGTRRTESEQRPEELLVIPEITPELLWRTSKESRELTMLSYSELRDLKELRPGRRDFDLAFQSHLTFPLANLILLILALPFSLSFERGRRIERVVFAVLVCALYLVVDLTCQNLSRSGGLHPVFASWVPPIVFGSLGIVFFGGIRT